MKIRNLVYSAIVGIVAVGVVFSLNASQAPQENKIRIAYFPNIGHAVPIVGIEKEFFANNLGESTEIETKLFDSGPQAIEALFANSIDIAYVGPGPTINGYLQSKEIQILAGAASGGVSFIVNPKSKISSTDDVDGKILAAPQIGNTQDVSLRYYLHENGLKPAEKGGSVVVLNVQNPEIYTLFAKGDIDGAWVPEPWATILVQDLGGERLFYEEELWPNHEFASVLLIARNEYVDNNPEIITKWLKAHDETVTWIDNNQNETKQIFNQFLTKTFGRSLPEKIINDSFANMKITSDPIEDSIYTFAKRADSLGYLGRHGYSLDGIFYKPQLNANLVEEDT